MKRATAAAGDVIHQSLFIVQEFIPKCETTFVGREGARCPHTLSSLAFASDSRCRFRSSPIRVQVEPRRQVSTQRLFLLQDVLQLDVLDGRVEDQGVPRPLLSRASHLALAPEIKSGSNQRRFDSLFQICT